MPGVSLAGDCIDVTHSRELHGGGAACDCLRGLPAVFSVSRLLSEKLAIELIPRGRTPWSQAPCQREASLWTPSIPGSVTGSVQYGQRYHHLLYCADVDEAAARIDELGGRTIQVVEEYRTRTIIAADTEGNEFCLVEHV